MPTLPSEVVEGPWARLFLPYEADPGDEGPAEVCDEPPEVARPGVRMLSRRAPPADPAEARPFARLHRRALDGDEADSPEAGEAAPDREIEDGERPLVYRLPFWS